MNTRELGAWGERCALDFLIEKKYTAVVTGYRTRFGEIDIIVCNSEFIVFVEVKLRKNSNFAEAREFVGRDKQRKLRATAGLWLAGNNNNLQPRFDVIEIYAPNGAQTKSPEIIHIENAF